MHERLQADDPEKRRAATTELARVTTNEPDAATEYAPLLVELTDDEAAGDYAAATLQRLVAAGSLDAASYVATLQAGMDDQQRNCSVLSWLHSHRGSPSPTSTDLQRAAALLAWIAKDQPAAIADEVETLLPALEREETRPGVIEALFHVSSQSPKSLDVPTEMIVTYFDDDNPRVRGDAIGIIGQLEQAGNRDTVPPHFSELIHAVNDPAVAVRQTAVGVLLRGSGYWPHKLSPRQLRTAVEHIATLRDTEPDPLLRSRADDLYRELAAAVLIAAIRAALGVDGVPKESAKEELVRAASEDLNLAYKIAINSKYQARASDIDETHRDEMLEQIAEYYSDQFESGDALLEHAQNNTGAIPDDRHDIISELMSTLLEGTEEEL